eukprot:155406-Rhodomonas_salina.1
MSGTTLAYASCAIALRPLYAMSGTDLAYQGTKRSGHSAPRLPRSQYHRREFFFAMILRACYEMSGTEQSVRRYQGTVMAEASAEATSMLVHNLATGVSYGLRVSAFNLVG